MRARSHMQRAVGLLASLLLAVGLAAALLWAPRDAVQGNAQRILYLHVPAILTAYVGIAVVLIASIAYLSGREM
ncbi:MAG TPA: cytochrome c biogenesis protein CcsA, partial [Solirubrobacterales bacterium]|nr:cytochrome c biogenesis protein CcsA [Solirubrobacterales bacterium]